MLSTVTDGKKLALFLKMKTKANQNNPTPLLPAYKARTPGNSSNRALAYKQRCLTGLEAEKMAQLYHYISEIV